MAYLGDKTPAELTAKTTPIDADLVILGDSTDASEVAKKVTWANIKATLKTYLDTLYQPLDSDLTTIAGLTATTDNFIVSVASAWASRTPTQVRTTLNVEDGADVTDSVNVGSVNAAATSKTTPVDADSFPITDSAASNVIKKVTFTNLKTFLNASPTFTGVMDYVQADGNEVALGNLGATEAIDWATGVYFTGAIDQDVAITFTNEASGRGITLDLVGDGTQETITWTDVDVWLDGDSGAAPAAPTLSTEHLIVTLKRIGSTTFASATGNYAVYA